MTRIKILSESRALLAPLTSAVADADAKKVLDEAIAEIAAADGDRVLAVNLRGSFMCAWCLRCRRPNSGLRVWNAKRCSRYSRALKISKRCGSKEPPWRWARCPHAAVAATRGSPGLREEEAPSLQRGRL